MNNLPKQKEIMLKSFNLHCIQQSVDPQCDILSPTARQLAVGSIELLENAKIFPTLGECIKDLERVYATTARTRYVIMKLFEYVLSELWFKL